jgi:hypothetical protein
MVGVAAFFDTLAFLLNLVLMGWLVVPVQYATFYVWFKMKGLSFFSLKKAPSHVAGSILEILSAGILPAFTAVVARVALSTKIKQVEEKITNAVDNKSEKRRAT